MCAANREMHLGVFVLGTGNHSSGWRYDGAAASNNDLSVIQEIARIAERGRFDLLFISDGLVMDPGDHPSFLCRFEPGGPPEQVGGRRGEVGPQRVGATRRE